MLENLIPGLAPPDHDDPEIARRGRLTNNILITITILAVVVLGIFTIFDMSTGSAFPEDNTSAITFVIGISLIGLNLGLKVLLNRGKINQVAVILVTFIFLAGILSTASFGGIRDSGTSIFILTVALASILLGNIAAYIFMALSLVATLMIYFAQSAHLIAANLPANVAITEWIVYAAILSMIGVLINTANHSIGQAFHASKELTTALEESNQELEQIKDQLEEEVASRVQIFERRSQYLEAAADVGRAATSIYTLEELLPKVSEYISERFGFYQVGIFLLDGIGEYAILRAANSLGGKRMLARGHRLKVGEEGMVGYVTSTGEARIALDTGEDATHFNTPELPNTRSEMTLPLFGGGRIFGALDVQSTLPNAFAPEDITALRVLADQVSMSINNAELFEQLQNSIESERRAYGEISKNAWKDILHSRRSWGYRFADKRVSSITTDWSPEMINAAQRVSPTKSVQGVSTQLIIPLKVSGTSFGAIRLNKKAGESEWTDDEIELIQALAENLTIALDSARLYRETQQRAVQEQLTSEIATNIRKTLDIDTVLQTAAKELGLAFNAEEVIIRMNIGEENGK